MDNSYDLAVEELNEATNPVEKQMLLQKYGMIEPKLTPEERLAIYEEHCVSLGYYGFQGEVFVGELK